MKEISDPIAYVQDAFTELSRLAHQMANEVDDGIIQSAELIVQSLQSGGKVLACGNGGSAADAQHFVAEFVGRLEADRRALPAITLSVDPSIVTALGNDYGYENLFARQVEALGQPGDVLFVISTSGRSPNVLAAIEAAQRKNIKTVALIGQRTNPTIDQCDVCISIPSARGMRIQEMHMAALHVICAIAEAKLG